MFKADPRPKLHCSHSIFLLILCKKKLVQCCGVLISFHEVMKLQSLEFGLSDVIPANIQNISSLVFFSFMEKKLSTKFYGVFDHFSRNYEVITF